MKKIVSLTLLLAFLNANLAWSVGKIQNEDVKSVTDLTNAGSDQTHLINTDKVYDILNAQQLSASISSGAIGGSGGSGGIELLSNTGFEGGTTGWTASGGTFTTVNAGANLIAGNKSADWIATASSQTLSSAAFVIKGLAGGQCSASMYYLYGGTAADYTFQVVDGSANILAKTSLGVQALANTPTILTFPCGGLTTATLKWQLISNVSSPGHIYVDTTHLGSLTVQQASQAQLLGGVTITGCSSQWTTSGTSFAAFSVVSGCTYTAFGQATAPGTQIPGLTFSSIPAGELIIQSEINWGNSGANKFSYLQFTDGTNTAREVSSSHWDVTGGGSESGIFQTIKYSTAQSNVTLQMFGKTDSGGSTFINAQNLHDGAIKVYLIPSTTTSTVSVGQQPQSWSGYWDTNCSFSTTSGTFADLTTGASSCGFHQLSNNNMGTVTGYNGTGTSAKAGIIFTPSQAGTYLVCVGGSGYNSVTSTDQNSIRLYDGTTVMDETNFRASANLSQTYELCGIEVATSVSPINIRVQGAVTGDTLTLDGSGVATRQASQTWKIVNLNSSLNAAQFNGPGQVNSSSTTNERIERASFGASGGSKTSPTACTSSPCTVYTQSGSWITSITRASTGQYTVNIAAGEFSDVPSCTLQQLNSSGSFDTCGANGVSLSSTSFGIQCKDFTQTFTDSAVAILCQGPH